MRLFLFNSTFELFLLFSYSDIFLETNFQKKFQKILRIPENLTNQIRKISISAQEICNNVTYILCNKKNAGGVHLRGFSHEEQLPSGASPAFIHTNTNTPIIIALLINPLRSTA